MIWAGLGCLLQGINSIIWNGNIINRVPVYCDIGTFVDALSLECSFTFHYRTVTRMQVAQNVAIPACSLCINRQLYRVATAKVMMPTYAEKRRAVIQDLLIGVGLPILQIIARECAPFTISELFTDAIKNTLFRVIVTTFLRILALSSQSRLRRRHSSSSTRGPWRSVPYPSSIVVSILECLRFSGFWLTSFSHGHPLVLQAPTPVQADIPYPRCQSWHVPPADGPFFHRDYWNNSIGDVFHCHQCKGGCYTLARLGLHAQPLFRCPPDRRLYLEK